MAKLRTRPFFPEVDSGNVPYSLDRKAHGVGIILAPMPASGFRLPSTALLMPSVEVADYAWNEAMRPPQKPGKHRKEL